MAPNAEANYKRSFEAIATQKPDCNAREEPCCDGFNTFASPACNGGSNRTGEHLTRMWGASGAGVVLLPEMDQEVKFNFVVFNININRLVVFSKFLH